MVQAVEKPKERQADALFRHLQKAREEGVKLLMDSNTEKWFATSSTMENVIYAVSETGCSCQGFRSFGRCKHFALYLDHIGKRPPTADELAAAQAEYERLSGLQQRNKLKSTADWRNLLNAKQTYTRLASLVTPVSFTPSPAA